MALDENLEAQDPSRTAGPDKGALREKVLGLLDFFAIRQQVASNTRFAPARTLALALSPAYEDEAVEALHRETAEGVAFLGEAGDIDLHSSEDASPSVERAGLGGALSGLELLAVAESMVVLGRVRESVLRARSSSPILAGLAETIPELGQGLARIRACVGERGEVLDEASPSLKGLRLQVREAYQRVAAALERIIQSSAGQEALQDQVISIRGDRLVLQVKTEMRAKIPGVVHDASNTGATLFVEPFTTAELCNAWREAALEEERETKRVLLELSTWVASVAADYERGVQTTAEIELILARARYSAKLQGVAARPSRGPKAQSSAGANGEIRLLKARHPLLGGKVVPIDLSIGPGWTVLVVAGPNTGGKTVAMKTLGLLALMHQAGLHIPAQEGCTLPVFDGIYADIGDQQSIQQSLSTFGSHMRNVIDILSQATPSSLVLLDELGTSTDPEEGSALAKAILGHLAVTGITTMATTHHRTVAAHASGTSGMMNASVELDPSTLHPTYHLTVGVPGRSYAMSVADQMGLSEEIMREARSLLEPQYLRFEDWLTELQGDRIHLKKLIEEAEEAKFRAESSQQQLESQREDLEIRREDILHRMRGELTAQYGDVRKKLRRAEASLSWNATSGEVTEAAAIIDDAREGIREIEQSPPEMGDSPARGPLAVGDTVDCLGLGARGTVVALHRQSEEAEVAIGSVRLRLGVRRLSRVPAPPTPEADVLLRHNLAPRLLSAELDLRGLRAEDALIEVEQFLDNALRDGLSSVRIVHGKGTGALRSAVRELLKRHPLAKSFAPEKAEKGGDGATVVELM